MKKARTATLSTAVEQSWAKEPLQIRIPIDVKRRFKAHAAMRGMEPNELFVEMWEQYERGTPRLPTLSETIVP